MTQTKLTAKPAAKATASKKRSKPDSEDDLSDDMGMSDDDSSLSQTPPKKVKKAPASKKGGSKPLADVENESFGGDVGDQPAKSTNASEKYQKVSAADFAPLFALHYIEEAC
jgi:DNA topoisomerase-2